MSVRRLMDLILETGLQAPVRAIDPRIWVKELSEQNTSAFLMVTKRPSSIEIAVRSTFDALDTTHIQILTLCDDDKQGEINFAI